MGCFAHNTHTNTNIHAKYSAFNESESGGRATNIWREDGWVRIGHEMENELYNTKATTHNTARHDTTHST